MAKERALKQDEDSVLPEKLAGLYKVADGVLQVFADNELGLIDLSNINEDMAEKLVKRGHLIKISPGG